MIEIIDVQDLKVHKKAIKNSNFENSFICPDCGQIVLCNEKEIECQSCGIILDCDEA